MICRINNMKLNKKGKIKEEDNINNLWQLNKNN